MPSLDPIPRANPEYVDSLYRRWLEDPDSVDPIWGLFFAGYQPGGGNGSGDAASAAAAERPTTPAREPIVLTDRGAIPEAGGRPSRQGE